MKKVSYADAKQFIDTGDLFLFHAHSLLGVIIQLKSKFWTHIGIGIKFAQFEGEEKRRWLAEAVAGGPRLTYLSHKIETYNGVVGWAPLKGFTEDMRNIVGIKALELMGVAEYDYPELCGQLVHAGEVNPTAVICSEYYQVVHGIGGKVKRPDQLLELPFLHDVMEVTFP